MKVKIPYKFLEALKDMIENYLDMYRNTGGEEEK